MFLRQNISFLLNVPIHLQMLVLRPIHVKFAAEYDSISIGIQYSLTKLSKNLLYKSSFMNKTGLMMFSYRSKTIYLPIFWVL